MRFFSLVLIAGALGTCSSRPSEPPVADASAEVASATPSPDPVSVKCETAACWDEQAVAAGRSGIPDVAAAHRGRAYASERSPARLTLWVDALIAAGQTRRARMVLGEARAEAREPEAIAAIDAKLQTLPASPRSSAPLSGGLRAAYDAELAGKLDEAVDGFARNLPDDADPDHLAYAGEVTWRQGGIAAARQLWSRARARIDELGGTLEVIPVETWFTSHAVWRGDDLALLRQFRPSLDLVAEPLAVLDLQPTGPGRAHARRLVFPGPVRAFAFSADGRTLVHDDAGALVLRDMSSGTVLVRVPPGREPIHRIAVVGSGDAMRILVASGRETTLHDARGRRLRSFTLTGTTPTITRAYTGEGSYHHNILKDEPSWPVALAMTDDASLVAIGGSDAKVRLFERDAKQPRELAFAWHYTEHRDMGGNPDSNAPLDLRFVAGGAELLAVHVHGDLLRWDTRRGAVIKHIAPDCTVDEARRLVNRYVEPGQPQREPTDEERRDCGAAVTAAFSPDGARVVTGGGLRGVRMRDVTTGAPQLLLLDREFPDQYLALAAGGALALVDQYGGAALLTAGQTRPTRLSAPEPFMKGEPTISGTGRYLHFEVDRKAALWDLLWRQDLLSRPAPLGPPPVSLVGPDEQFVGIAGDGQHAAVFTGKALEIRDVRTGAVRFSAPHRSPAHYHGAIFTSTSRHVLINMFSETDRALSLIELPAGKGADLRVDLRVDIYTRLWLSDDARWLGAVAGHEKPLQIWRAATGERIATIDEPVLQVAFARDGAFVAWIRQNESRTPGGMIKLRYLDGPVRKDTPSLAFDGWGEWVAISPAGDEVLFLGQNGDVTRWRPADGTRRDVRDTDLVLSHRAHYSDDGKTVLFEAFGRVDIRANDQALTPLATVASLPSGGWLARSRAGALDGSSDAPDHLVTRVRGAGEAHAHGGRLAWDALHVPGLVARALAGEDVAPPLSLAAAAPRP